MPSADFKRLFKAVQEMKAIQRGTLTPGRVTKVKVDAKGSVSRRAVAPGRIQRRQAALYAASVAGVREQMGLSQQELANLLGISRRTLENWEQGRREPTGAAKVLLRVVSRTFLQPALA